MGGLATPLFTLVLVAATWTFVREEARGRGWHSGWLFGLLVVTQPEGLFFAGIAGLVRLWRLYRGRGAPRPPRLDPGRDCHGDRGRPRFIQVIIKRRGWPGRWKTNFTGTDHLVNDPRFERLYRYVKAPRVNGLFERRETLP